MLTEINVVPTHSQADLTHHLFNVHLQSSTARLHRRLVQTDASPCHLTSDLVLEPKRSGQFQNGGCVVRQGERDELHQEEIEDFVEVVGKGGTRAPYGHASEYCFTHSHVVAVVLGTVVVKS